HGGRGVRRRAARLGQERRAQFLRAIGRRVRATCEAALYVRDGSRGELQAGRLVPSTRQQGSGREILASCAGTESRRLELPSPGMELHAARGRQEVARQVSEARPALLPQARNLTETLVLLG